MRVSLYLYTQITRGLAMAGNVIGNIGQDSVLLENAATESTLAAILAAIQGGTKEQKQNISNIVQKAGLDPAQVAQANQGLSAVGKTSAVLGGALGGLNVAANGLSKALSSAVDVAAKFTDNQGKASDFFSTFAGMGGVVGLVANGFQKIAAFQESNLEMYQKISQNGISFGGSLTDMRLAASKMGLSIEEFTSIMKNHSQAFALMGENADDGAKSFKNLSIQMYNSRVGDNLRALGLTTAEVNESMANYIAMTGGRNKKEMQNTDQLIAETAQYVEHLTVLSEITGKNRKEEEEKLKQLSMQAAWENYIAKLRITDPKAAEKATAGLQESLTRGGKGAAETFQQQSMGFAGGMTKASKEFMGYSQNAAGAVSGLVTASKDSSKSLKDMGLEGSKISYGLKKDADAYGNAGAAISLIGQGSEEFNNQLKASTQAINQGLETEADYRRQVENAEANLDRRKKSEADQAAKNIQAFQKLGQLILESVMPIFNRLSPYLLQMGEALKNAIKWVNDTPGALKGVAIAAGALAAAFTAVKVAQGVQATRAAFGIGGGAPAMGAGAGGEGPGKAIGGVADGLGKVGPMLSSLGKGAGDMFSGIMKGIASGITAFANPQILLGAGIFAGAIAIIGAGIAAATWILGKALPTFAEGLLAFNDVDGKNLGEVGTGAALMGAGLAVFGAGGALAGVGAVIGGLAEKFGSFFGAKSPIEKMKEFAALGPELKVAGDSLAVFNKNLAVLLATDSDKIKNMATNLKNLATTFKELKEASKPVETSFFDQATDFLKAKLTAEATATPAAGKDGKDGKNVVADIKPVTTTSKDPAEILKAEVATLNSITMELLRAMRETRDNTKSTANILASNGNLFRRA